MLPAFPVCLVTFKGEGLNETALRDLAQFQVRNQIASVPGASVPQPFGGRYRQIMVYADPYKLEAHQLSLMDVVRSVNNSNLILPAGDVQLGMLDYNIYTNSQLSTVREINNLPVKTVGQAPVRISDIGYAKDAQQIQTNLVRVDGQPSVYLPVLKQGGDTNTIAVVDGIKDAVQHLFDVPKELVSKVVFDQSVFVKTAIETLLHEGAIGLFLTSIMILVFLGSMRATVAVFFSIPLSALAAFIALSMGGGSINSMVLGGLALAFSRLIDNSVVVLENIYRHLELGESPEVAAEKGGKEVALPVLAATLDHGGRLLPCHLPLRRQQIPVLRTRPGGGAIAVCFLRGRDDGGAALLRPFHQSAGASRHAVIRTGSNGGPSAIAAQFRRSLQHLVQQPLRKLPPLLRPHRRRNSALAGGNARRRSALRLRLACCSSRCWASRSFPEPMPASS